MKQISGSVILLAAGRGERMGPGEGKVWLPLAGRPLLQHCLDVLAICPSVESIVVVTRREDRERTERLLRPFPKPWQWCVGGEQRQDSLGQGLQHLPPAATLVAVHDAARPFASCRLFCEVLSAADRKGAALAACLATDTVKEVEESGRVAATLDRSRLWLAQTPQAFRRELLTEAYRSAQQARWYATDEAALVERLGRPVYVVPGERWNRKITYPEDRAWAEAWWAHTRSAAFPAVEQRVGYGYDIHPFAADRPLWLGGVNIAPDHGLAGHSDADVILHALSDALLGAAALGDIGHHFPNSDPTYRGIASLRLLEQTWDMVSRQGWLLSNADMMVLAERPRLAPFLPEMCRKIAAVLGCDQGQISIKATTHEGLGAIGSGQGIAAHAVVHLWRSVAGFH